MMMARRHLPIESVKKEFDGFLKSNRRVLVVKSETGSGKTTTLPVWAVEIYPTLKVVCTQPRRVAAKSVAEYVVRLRGGNVGEEVGYAIRFEHEAGKHLTYMTEGILIRKAVGMPYLDEIGLLFIDEAHERNVNTDLVLGLAKRALEAAARKRRLPFKVVVMSATIQTDKFAKYFDDCSVLAVRPGASEFNVEVFYQPVNRQVPSLSEETRIAAAASSVTASCDAEEDDEDEEDDDETVMVAAAELVKNIHLSSRAGDVLVFMPGECEILETVKRIQSIVEKAGTDPKSLVVLPLLSHTPDEDQAKVFEKLAPGVRKCVIATNIAESSITIPGVAFVIDSGLARVKKHDFSTGMDQLLLEPISKPSADQRKGRTGRTCDGVCYRLYSPEEYNSLPDSKPEISRVQLDSMVIRMKAAAVGDVTGHGGASDFVYMENPPVAALENAVVVLRTLGALDDSQDMRRLNLSDIGKSMACVPLEPRWARVFLAAVAFGTGNVMVKMLAMISAPDCFTLPMDMVQKNSARDDLRESLGHFQSDHRILSWIFNTYNKICTNEKEADNYCRKYLLRRSALDTALKIAADLTRILQACSNLAPATPNAAVGNITDRVWMTLFAGFPENVARRTKEGYKIAGVGGGEPQRVDLHGDSILFRDRPEFVFYSDCVDSGNYKPKMRKATALEMKVLQLMPPSAWKDRLCHWEQQKPKNVKKTLRFGKVPPSWDHVRIRRELLRLAKKHGYLEKKGKEDLDRMDIAICRGLVTVKFNSRNDAEAVYKILEIDRGVLSFVELDA